MKLGAKAVRRPTLFVPAMSSVGICTSPRFTSETMSTKEVISSSTCR